MIEDSLKLPLFRDKKELLIASILAIALFLLHLSFQYSHFIDLKKRDFIIIKDAKVLSAYPHRLKLYSSSIGVFYTKRYIRDVAPNDRLRLIIYPKEELSFIKYLKGAYFKSKLSSIVSKNLYSRDISHFIESQHKNSQIADFYKAIYFAYPLSKELRKRVSRLGVSHLIALSGFHLGILSAIIFLILSPIYKFFQSRYFPYRYIYKDLGVITLIILASYIYLTGYPPSLLRAYAMMVVGYIALIVGVEILSFSTLALAFGVLIILLPSLLLSVAFWLSIVGVLYIFLIVKFLEGRVKSRILVYLLLSWLIFILMLPIIHSIFPTTTIYQLFSPILSILFILFYPISIILHLIGFGGVFDLGLERLFYIDSKEYRVMIPFSITILYVIWTTVTIFKPRFFKSLLISALLIDIYILSYDF